MDTKKLVDEAIALPVEERALLIDCLLRSLNPIEEEIEKKWIEEARKRLEDVRKGKTKLKSGEKVFSDILSKL